MVRDLYPQALGGFGLALPPFVLDKAEGLFNTLGRHDRVTGTHDEIQLLEAVLSFSKSFRELLHVGVDGNENGFVLQGCLADYGVFRPVSQSFPMVNHREASICQNLSNRIRDARIQEKLQRFLRLFQAASTNLMAAMMSFRSKVGYSFMISSTE